MSYFDKAYEHLSKWEGGFVDHPDDPGGLTNHGVSIRWYMSVFPEKEQSEAENDIRNMTPDEAKDLYEQYWWRPEFDLLDDVRVATVIFSTGVNMGMPRAVRIAQQTANNLGFKLQVDGVMGPKTRIALNDLKPDAVLREMRKLLVLRRLDLAKVKHPFIRGWVRRDLDL